MDEKDRRKNNRKNEENGKVCHQRPYKLGLQQVDLKKKNLNTSTDQTTILSLTAHKIVYL